MIAPLHNNNIGGTKADILLLKIIVREALP